MLALGLLVFLLVGVVLVPLLDSAGLVDANAKPVTRPLAANCASLPSAICQLPWMRSIKPWGARLVTFWWIFPPASGARSLPC